MSANDNDFEPQGRKAPKLWSEQCTMTLFDVWRSCIQELRVAKRNIHIYRKMAAKMSNMGVEVTASEIRVKINNLSQRYRAERKKADPSDRFPSTWKYYFDVESILAGFSTPNVGSIHEIVYDESSSNSSYFKPIVDESAGNEQPIVVDDKPVDQQPGPSSTQIKPAIPCRNRKRKRNFKQAIFKEMRKMNKLIKEDITATRALMEEAGERDKMWMEFVKDYLERSLQLQIRQSHQNSSN